MRPGFLMPIFKMSEALAALAVLGSGAAPAELVFTASVIEQIRNIAYRGLGNVLQRLLRQKGLMGGDDDIGHGDETGEGIVLQNVA